MKLLEYLRSNGVFDQKTLSELRDSAALSKRSIYQEIFMSPKGAAYSIPFEDLSEFSKAAANQDGEQLTVISATSGLECDKCVYDALGGISDNIVKSLIPLIDQATGERFALTVCPDNDIFMERVHRAYKGQAYTRAICDYVMWQSVYGMYVEPLLLGRMASSFSATTDRSTVISDKSKDSEMRQLYTKLLNVGITQRASDVHFLPCSTECKVLFRIDGNNQEYTSVPKDVAECIANILKSDGGISVSDPRMPLDGKVRFSPSQGRSPNDYIDLRVSIIPTRAGSDLNVRYLTEKLYTFEELGMSQQNVELYKNLLELPSGLVVQVGPTGSGKSTTLYAGLRYVHTSLRNIITIEDPVEILMDGISQVDVSADSKGGLTFASALKACLRHDPDVVVVGELRDNDTAFEAVRAANTGHLVLTSLHTNDSIGAFERLVNLGIDPYSLGEVIAAVMGQRLVRRLCPYCKEPYHFSLKSDEARLYRFPAEDRVLTLYRPRGCPKCNNTGYRGRVAINEVLCVDRTLRDFIQKHAVRKYFEDYLREIKFKTMYHDGLSKVVSGVTSLEELTKFAKDVIAFKG